MEPIKRVEHTDCQDDVKVIASYADIGVGPAVVFDGAAFTDPEACGSGSRTCALSVSGWSAPPGERHERLDRSDMRRSAHGCDPARDHRGRRCATGRVALMRVAHSHCTHEAVRSRVTVRPSPDWTQTCRDCGERVKHNGRGGFVTVREANDRLRREREAVDAFREQWARENPL